MKVYDFDHIGRSIAIRMILLEKNIPFQFVKIPIVDDWNIQKKSSEFAFKSIPILELEDGTRLTYSQSIYEFLAFKYGYLLYNESMVYTAKEIMEDAEECIADLISSESIQYDDIAIKNFQSAPNSNKISLLYEKLENILSQNNDPNFFIGNSNTIIDFVVQQLKIIFDGFQCNISNQETSSKCPKLIQYFQSKETYIENFNSKSKINYKLYYFDMPGRAESIRLLFRHSGIPFEDCRLTMEQFNEEKKQGKFEYNQMPALQEDENKMYVQTDAILQFLGIRYGYIPSDPKLFYQVQNVIGGVKDISEPIVKVLFSKISDKSKEKLKETLFRDTIPYIFSLFDTKVKLNNCEFIAGNSISIADFAFIGFLRGTAFNKNFPLAAGLKTILDKFHNLSSYVQKRNAEFN